MLIPDHDLWNLKVTCRFFGASIPQHSIEASARADIPHR
jgi:hypothetical protein